MGWGVSSRGQKIERVFDGEVRVVVPLFDSDIRGVPSLEKAARNLFA